MGERRASSPLHYLSSMKASFSLHNRILDTLPITSVSVCLSFCHFAIIFSFIHTHLTETITCVMISAVESMLVERKGTDVYTQANFEIPQNITGRTLKAYWPISSRDIAGSMRPPGAENDAEPDLPIFGGISRRDRGRLCIFACRRGSQEEKAGVMQKAAHFLAVLRGSLGATAFLFAPLLTEYKYDIHS